MSLLPENIHPSWNPLLTNSFIAELKRIENKLNSLTIHEESQHRSFPKTENVMRFLEIDLNSVKYIILGMDPYPSWYEIDGTIFPVATGRSFEVGNLNSWQQKFNQKSLQNILKTIYFNKTGEKVRLAEIRELMADNRFTISPPHQWFDNLEAQGVLFLNATLTVTPRSPDSHTQDWKFIMTQVIRYVNSTQVCWLLFGKEAQKRVREAILGEFSAHNCCHPRNAQFVDENIFQYAADIDWCGVEII